MLFQTAHMQNLGFSVEKPMPMIRRVWLVYALLLGITLTSIAFAETGALSIEKIECEGNSHTDCAAIISQTLLHVGDTLEDEKVKDSALRLRLAGTFDEADIRLAKGSEVGKVILTISVKERSNYQAIGSVGYDLTPVNHFFAADATVGDTNLTGHSDSLSLRFRNQKDIYTYASGTTTQEAGNSIAASLEYIRPAFLFSRMYFVSGIGYGKEQYEDRYGYQYGSNAYDVNYEYTYTKKYAYAFLGYKIFDYWSVALGWRYTWLNSETKYIAPNGDTYLDVFGNNQSSAATRTIIGQISRDSQDNANFPTQGSRFEFDLEFSSDVVPNLFYPHSDGYLSYLKHWRISEHDILSLKFGRAVGTDSNFKKTEDDGASLRYTNYFKRHEIDATIQNANYYLEPGAFNTDHGYRPGVRVGTSFQTNLGTINLFFVGVFGS